MGRLAANSRDRKIRPGEEERLCCHRSHVPGAEVASRSPRLSHCVSPSSSPEPSWSPESRSTVLRSKTSLRARSSIPEGGCAT